MSQRELKLLAAIAQLLAQRGVVINFAVEDDGGIAVFRAHGLVAAFEIEDPETDGPQGDEIGFEGPMLIGTSMLEA